MITVRLNRPLPAQPGIKAVDGTLRVNWWTADRLAYAKGDSNRACYVQVVNLPPEDLPRNLRRPRDGQRVTVAVSVTGVPSLRTHVRLRRGPTNNDARYARTLGCFGS